jgi:hypothetical protein
MDRCADKAGRRVELIVPLTLFCAGCIFTVIESVVLVEEYPSCSLVTCRVPSMVDPAGVVTFNDTSSMFNAMVCEIVFPFKIHFTLPCKLMGLVVREN